MRILACIVHTSPDMVFYKKFILFYIQFVVPFYFASRL